MKRIARRNPFYPLKTTNLPTFSNLGGAYYAQAGGTLIPLTADAKRALIFADPL